MKPEGWYTGVVHLWQLDHKKVYIDLKEPFKIRILRIAKQVTKNWTNLARAINLKISSSCVNQIQSFKRGLCGRLDFIIKLCKFLEANGYDEFTLENVERHVSKIRKMYGSNPVISPQLPFNFNNEDGYVLISSILHDGHLSRGIMYTNTSLQLKRRVVRAFKKVIGKCRIKVGGTYVWFPYIFGIILKDGLGLEAGKKIEINPHVPHFIFNGDASLVGAYLRQAFDDEGSVSNSSITLTLTTKERENPPNLLIAISKLLKKLNIKHTGPMLVGKKIASSGKISYLWRIGIYGKENLENFAVKVGFSLKYKRGNLERALRSIKRYKFGQGKAIQELLKIAIEIEKEGGKITSTELSKRLRKNRNHIGSYLKKMCELRLLEKIKDHKPLGRGGRPAEYKVITC